MITDERLEEIRKNHHDIIAGDCMYYYVVMATHKEIESMAKELQDFRNYGDSGLKA